MEGYYITPNRDVPLNDREPGEVAPIALTQLQQWQAIAKDWPTKVDLDRDGRQATICDRCYQVLWFMADRSGHPYVYTPQMRDALKVSHIRQNHSEVNSEPI